MSKLVEDLKNKEKMLGIWGILVKTVQDWEAIVIDDSTNKATLDLLKQLSSFDSRVKVMGEPTRRISSEMPNRIKKSWHGSSNNFMLLLPRHDNCQVFSRLLST